MIAALARIPDDERAARIRRAPFPRRAAWINTLIATFALSVACLIALPRERPVPLPQVVSSYRLADDAVTTYKIADQAVVSHKLADGAVTLSKIAAGAVSADAISSGAVGERALAAGSVRGAHVAPGAITASALSEGAVQREHVAAGAIGIGQLDPAALLQIGATNQSAVWGAVSAEGEVYASPGAPFTVEVRSLGVYSVRWERPFATSPVVLVSATSFAICYAPRPETGRHGATVHCRRPGFSLAHSSTHGSGVAAISLEDEDGEAARCGFSLLVWGEDGRGGGRMTAA